ncbi:MAG: ubiquinol-cytochrome c chaperone [Hyphomicrobiales bacterium]|nr:ubiquinol-cytochrome c chaperone [Hyphomicrobiales bacterium]MDE2113294.1 ubiquinol-cytochrome c chaperone [Hyphomicrobiales bacterium]
MLQRFFRKSRNRALIVRLHGDVVAASRQKAFYLEYGVADSFEGRFEMVAIHSGLLLKHLQSLPAPGKDVAQDLIDAVFESFDTALREIGVSDVSVGKKMKQLAEAFLGRTRALDAALSKDDLMALQTTLSRNALAGEGDSARLAQYVLQVQAGLKNVPLAVILTSAVPFPDAAQVIVPAL